MGIIPIWKCSICGEVFEDDEKAINHTDHKEKDVKDDKRNNDGTRR